MKEDVFWAANMKAPLTRDEQIQFMKTSRERWERLEESIRNHNSTEENG